MKLQMNGLVVGVLIAAILSTASPGASSDFPTYEEVLAGLPAGTELCETSAGLSRNPDGSYGLGGVGEDRAKITIRESGMQMLCPGARYTVTEKITLDNGTVVPVGGKLTVGADGEFVRISGWEGDLHKSLRTAEDAAALVRKRVTEAQKLLAALDYSPGPADGMMGPGTGKAVREFQEFSGLVADGKVTGSLLDELRSAKATAPGATDFMAGEDLEIPTLPAQSMKGGRTVFSRAEDGSLETVLTAPQVFGSGPIPKAGKPEVIDGKVCWACADAIELAPDLKVPLNPFLTNISVEGFDLNIIISWAGGNTTDYVLEDPGNRRWGLENLGLFLESGPTGARFEKEGRSLRLVDGSAQLIRMTVTPTPNAAATPEPVPVPEPSVPVPALEPDNAAESEVAAAPASSPTAEHEPGHFRRARWGMTPDAVKAVEDLEFCDGQDDASDSKLCYSGGSHFGFDAAFISYKFKNGQLTGGHCIFVLGSENALQPKPDDRERAEEKLEALRQVLVSQYGEPLSDQTGGENQTVLWKTSDSSIALRIKRRISIWVLLEYEAGDTGGALPAAPAGGAASKTPAATEIAEKPGTKPARQQLEPAPAPIPKTPPPAVEPAPSTPPPVAAKPAPTTRPPFRIRIDTGEEEKAVAAQAEVAEKPAAEPAQSKTVTPPAVAQAPPKADPQLAAEAEQPVTLFDAVVPSPVTLAGGIATVSFRSDRSLEGERLQLAIGIPVGQGGVSFSEQFLYQADQPRSGHFSISSATQGEVRLHLSTPVVRGAPDYSGRQRTITVTGDRSIGVELYKCLDPTCRQKSSLSNRVKVQVRFTTESGREAEEAESSPKAAVEGASPAEPERPQPIAVPGTTAAAATPAPSPRPEAVAAVSPPGVPDGSASSGAKSPTPTDGSAASDDDNTGIRAEDICNAFGQTVTTILYNNKNERVAQWEREFNGSFIMSERLIEPTSGKTIRTWTFDEFSRRVGVNILVCLDADGNWVRDGQGAPLVVPPFTARQRKGAHMRYNEYNSSILAGRTITIFPCENCKEETGGRCSYVY